MQLLLNLLSLLNKKTIIYIVLTGLILSIFVYQKIKISNLEKEIVYIKLKLKDKQNSLDVCKSNVEVLKNNNLSKDNVIKHLQKEIKNQKSICGSLLSKKDKLIADLQKIKISKPRDIKPTVIEKKECKFKIETGDDLDKKDIVFHTLSNIGK